MKELTLLWTPTSPAHLAEEEVTAIVTATLAEKVTTKQLPVFSRELVNAFIRVRDQLAFLAVLDSTTYREYEVSEQGEWENTPTFLLDPQTPVITS